MGDLGRLIWCLVAGLFRSRAALQAEVLVLRHQRNVLRRKSPERLVFNNIDRLVFAGLYGLAPNVLDALRILKPETVVRWHRWLPRLFATAGGRPRVSAEVRELIREMSTANPLWGAPWIHGEPLKLGIDVGQTTVAKYMARKGDRRRSFRQGQHRASLLLATRLFLLLECSDFLGQDRYRHVDRLLSEGRGDL
jgi:hypothetical protein